MRRRRTFLGSRELVVLARLDQIILGLLDLLLEQSSLLLWVGRETLALAHGEIGRTSGFRGHTSPALYPPSTLFSCGDVARQSDCGAPGFGGNFYGSLGIPHSC